MSSVMMSLRVGWDAVSALGAASAMGWGFANVGSSTMGLSEAFFFAEERVLRLEGFLADDGLRLEDGLGGILNDWVGGCLRWVII